MLRQQVGSEISVRYRTSSNGAQQGAEYIAKRSIARQRQSTGVKVLTDSTPGRLPSRSSRIVESSSTLSKALARSCMSMEASDTADALRGCLARIDMASNRRAKNNADSWVSVQATKLQAILV